MRTRQIFQLQAVMGMAHRIRRQTAERLGCRPGEVLFSECLRMAWEINLTGHHGATCDNRIHSPKGYSTKSSAWRAARSHVGKTLYARHAFEGDHPSISYADVGITGADKTDWLPINIVVREDMLSVYHAVDGWHWAAEWWLEDLFFTILDRPDPNYPEWCEHKEISFRELVLWDGPRTESGWPCLDPRYAA